MWDLIVSVPDRCLSFTSYIIHNEDGAEYWRTRDCIRLIKSVNQGQHT